MNTFLNAVKDYLDWIVFPKISITDVLEIFILAYLVYHLIVWVRNTRAWVLFKGLVIILGFALVAAILQLNVVLWIFAKTISVGIIAIFIVFQPELRRALEQLGSRNIMSSIFVFDDQEKNDRFSKNTISQIITATLDLAKSSMGALIVVEHEVRLAEYESTGIKLDSNISSQLLINIFEKNTPLHDGAVIIRGDRIVAATCYLPLSDNKLLSKDMGTRHRAAVGITEVSDSIVIIVSEETGKISIARDGKITRNVDSDKIRKELMTIQKKVVVDPKKNKIKNLKGWRKNEKKADK